MSLTPTALAQPATPVPTSQATTRPTAASPQFDALVRAVDAAHRGASRERAFDRFVGSLSITPMGDGQDPIEVRLAAQFLAPNLLRYQVEEAGRKLERGSDAKGMWARDGERVYRITGREFAEERRQVKQHIRLARQLLEFLDPAATMRQLRDPSPVTERTLAIGRREFGACQHVRGALDEFPLFGGEGAAARVEIELWAQRGLLTAIRAVPIDDDGKPTGDPEFVLLQDYRELNGVQVPTKLTIYSEPAPPRPRQAIARIEIARLDLEAKLDEAALARPK